MALIKCSECGGKVSDTTEECIHCGFSLKAIRDHYERQEKKICKINGVDYDFTIYFAQLMDPELTTDEMTEIIRDLHELTGVCGMGVLCHSIREMRDVPPTYDNKTMEQFDKEVARIEAAKNNPSCPRCGSKSITAATKGFTLLEGIWGSNDPVNYCKNCGHKWKPRR